MHGIMCLSFGTYRCNLAADDVATCPLGDMGQRGWKACAERDMDTSRALLRFTMSSRLLCKLMQFCLFLAAMSLGSAIK